MEERPPQGTMELDPDGVLPTIVDPLDMLPDPEDLVTALATLSGLDDPTEANLKAACRNQADTLQSQQNAANRQRLARNKGTRRAAGRSRTT